MGNCFMDIISALQEEKSHISVTQAHICLTLLHTTLKYGMCYLPHTQNRVLGPTPKLLNQTTWEQNFKQAPLGISIHGQIQKPLASKSSPSFTLASKALHKSIPLYLSTLTSCSSSVFTLFAL